MAAISFVLWVATAALWVRSEFAADRLTFYAGNHSVRLWTIRRCFYAQWSTPRYFLPGFRSESPFDGWQYADIVRPQIIDQQDTSGRPRSYRWLGFFLRPTYCQPASHQHPATWFTQVGVPFYAMFVMTALLPAYQMQRWLRRRHRLSNLCTTCGYDLRASPERCPECGTVGFHSQRAPAK